MSRCLLLLSDVCYIVVVVVVSVVALAVVAVAAAGCSRECLRA